MEEAKEITHTSQQGNPYGRVDQEVAAVAEEEVKRKKRMKYFVYSLTFIVFLTSLMLIIGLTVLRVQTPRCRVRSATFDRFDIVTSNTNSSFNIRMIAELGIRNTNFGRYRSYHSSAIEFFYHGTRVGQTTVPGASVRARSTRRFNVMVDLSSVNVPTEVMSNENRIHAIIPLTSLSTLRGRISRRNRSSITNCTMQINISSRQLRNISCR